MPPTIYDLDFDEWNLEKLGRRSISDREVRQVLDNDPVFLRNKREHRAEILMVGPTLGGRFLTVPLARTEAPDIWRPATGWESDQDEVAKYRKHRRGGG